VVVTATPEPVKERPEVTIEWWTDPAFNTAPRCETCKNPGDFEKLAIAEYVKDNPNVTVNVQVLDWGDLPKERSERRGGLPGSRCLAVHHRPEPGGGWWVDRLVRSDRRTQARLRAATSSGQTSAGHPG